MALLGYQPEGGFGGGQIGYNIQRGNIVFGLEADFEGADINGSKTANGTYTDPAGNQYAASLGLKTTLDWFGTLRGRVGYTFDRALVYGTGGFAYGHVKDEATLAVPGLGVASGSKELMHRLRWRRR